MLRNKHLIGYLLSGRVSFRRAGGAFAPLAMLYPLEKFLKLSILKSKKLVTPCIINASNSLKYVYTF